MTEAMRIVHQETTLTKLGFTTEEAATLRRASIALRRWAERECNGEIERDANGNPHLIWGAQREFAASIRDQEASAIKRINATLAMRNARSAGADRPESALSWYHQGDPRGCAVYILRPGDVPDGESARAHYDRGVAVF